MRTKYGFGIMIVGLTLLIAIGVSAQNNAAACPTFVQEAFTATELLCETVTDGQACLGNGTVSTTPFGDASVQFADPGNLANLSNIQRLQAQTINSQSGEFTSVIAKLAASTPDGTPQIVDMLIFGDAVITNTVEQSAAVATGGIFPATVEAAGGVIIRQDALANSNNIWQLLNGESIQAIGRSSDNQWVRVLIPSPNGGAGWVFGQFVNVEGGRELLPFHTNSSPIPEASTEAQPTTALKSMQSFRLESLLADPSCVDTPDGGVMLQSPTLDTRALVEVNGVELQIQGTVYLTAQIGDKMTIYNLEGDTAVIVNDSRLDMIVGTMTEVPLDASLAPTSAPTTATPYSQEVADLLVFLPIRILTRNFEIITTDSSSVASTTTDTTTDTSEPAEQAAPPPPAATEVPPEVVEEPANCPTIVQQAYTSTEFLCENLNPNSACIGNTGTDMIVATARTGVENFTFAAPNDIVNSTDISTLSTRVFDDPDNKWVSIIMSLDAKTTTGAIAQATILVLGEVELENVVEETLPEDTAVTTDPVVAASPTPTTLTTEITEPTTSGEGIPAAVESPGGIIVRAQPRVDTETIGQLQDGDPVTALGRSVDQQWVQIQSANGVTGWVFVQFVAVEGGEDALPIIDPNAETSDTTAPPPPPATNQQTAPPPAVNNAATGEEPEFTSLQAFEFSSNDVEEDCNEAHSGGILIQSPSEMDGNMRLEINGIEFEINGTIFITASLNENTRVIGLEGEISVTAQGSTQLIEAGKQSTIQMINGLEPNSAPSIPGEYSYDNSQRFLFLPIRLLPRNFEVVVPPRPADAVVEDTSETSDETDNTLSTDTSENTGRVNIGGTIVDFDADCQISAGDSRRNLRADAGTSFDVISVLQVGETIEAKTQKRGPDRYYWYETSRGWIRSDAGIATEDCEFMPLFGVFYDLTSSGGNISSVAPVAPPPPAQPTATPLPPLQSELFGNVCSSSGFSIAVEVEDSGKNYYEFGGVWTGQPGRSVTFSAEVPYFRPEIQNILTFVNEDGSPWLGSINNSSFTINFDSARRFRVRVGALLGDFITLRVNC